MKNLITICDEYEWLLIETQQKPLPEALEPYRNNIFFITPVEGDLAKVKNKEYIFQNGAWIEHVEEPEERDGYYAVRYIDPVTKEFGYIYREIVEEE